MDVSRKKVVVIGGGASGLTAGIYALKYGFDVDIYEKNSYVGGLCTGWRRKGSYIDGCIHWLTESNYGALNDLWRDVGALSPDVRIHHYDVYCQVRCNGHDVNFFTDPQKLRDELLHFAKTDNDKRLVKQFVWAVKRCKTNAITVHKPYHLWRIWDVARFLFKAFSIFPVIKKFGKVGIDDFVERLDSDELRFAFANNLCPDKYSVFSIASTYGGIASQNSGVPIGGSKAFAERMLAKFLSLGGRIHTSAPADEIVVRNGHVSGVRMADGNIISADYYITACDLHYVLGSLLRGRFHIKQLDQRDASSGHFPVFSCFVLTYRTRQNLNSLTHNRYLQCQPYSILSRSYDAIYVKHFDYDEVVSSDGWTVVQSLITTDQAQYEQLARMSRVDYLSLKADVDSLFRNRLAATVADEYGDLELLDVASPLTFARYTHAYKGSFMAYMFTKFGKQMIIRNDVLPLDNIALAGHWMMVPGGLPVAVMQGKFAAMSIAHFAKHGRDVSQGDDNVDMRSL